MKKYIVIIFIKEFFKHNKQNLKYLYSILNYLQFHNANYRKIFYISPEYKDKIHKNQKTKIDLILTFLILYLHLKKCLLFIQILIQYFKYYINNKKHYLKNFYN